MAPQDLNGAVLGRCSIGQKGYDMHTKPLRQLVVSAEDMDDETFLAHFEKRHIEQLPNMPDGFIDTIWQQPELIETYRSFHNKIHALIIPGTMEHPHEHE